MHIPYHGNISQCIYFKMIYILSSTCINLQLAYIFKKYFKINKKKLSKISLFWTYHIMIRILIRYWYLLELRTSVGPIHLGSTVQKPCSIKASLSHHKCDIWITNKTQKQKAISFISSTIYFACIIAWKC